MFRCQPIYARIFSVLKSPHVCKMQVLTLRSEPINRSLTFNTRLHRLPTLWCMLFLLACVDVEIKQSNRKIYGKPFFANKCHWSSLLYHCWLPEYILGSIIVTTWSWNDGLCILNCISEVTNDLVIVTCQTDGVLKVLSNH